VRAYLDRKVWRVKAQIAPGPEGRETLALPFFPEEGEAAQARAALVGELLAGLVAAGQAEELRRDVVRTLCSLPEGDELQAHVRFVRSKLISGAYVRGDRGTTVRALGQDWTSGTLARRFPDHVRAKRSADQDERFLRLYVYPTLGDVPVSAVRLEHLQAVMGGLPSRLGAASRRHVAQVLARLLALAVYPCQLLERSPVPKGFLPRVPRPSFAFLYPAEEARLLACRQVPLLRRVLYGVLAREGLRREEAARAQWFQVDLERGILLLSHHKTSATTGARGWRLGADVVEVLRWWRRRTPGPDVFPGVATSNLARQLRADLALAGVDRAELFEGEGARRRLRAHDLRATFVTLALAAGRSEAWVTDRTGHTSSEVLARYRRGARLAAEVGLGWLASMAEAIPEVVADVPRPLAVRGADDGDGVMADISAEREGFEPSVPLQVHMISNRGEAPPSPESSEEFGAPPGPGGACGRAADGPLSALREALEAADKAARDLDLPRVRIRLANIRRML